MTVPLWCLALVTFLPYVWAPFTSRSPASAARQRRQQGPARLQYAQLTGRGARALGAHQNAFEALAVFAPAVLVAHLAGADPLWSARLASLFVVARVLHGASYLTDLDVSRSRDLRRRGGVRRRGSSCSRRGLSGGYAFAAKSSPRAAWATERV